MHGDHYRSARRQDSRGIREDTQIQLTLIRECGHGQMQQSSRPRCGHEIAGRRPLVVHASTIPILGPIVRERVA